MGRVDTRKNAVALTRTGLPPKTSSDLERKGGSLSRVRFLPMERASNFESWFAVRVRSRCEKLAASELAARRFEVCAATAPHRRIWIDRVRTVEMPLFPGYIFARFVPDDQYVVRRCAGIADIVGVAGQPYPIPDEEMESIQILLRSGVDVQKAPFLHIGERVRVRWGPLAGVVGVLERIKSQCRLLISVDFLQRSVAVEVDSALVEPVRLRNRQAEGYNVA